MSCRAVSYEAYLSLSRIPKGTFMCKLKLFLLTGALITALTVGCQPLIIAVTPTAENPEQSATATASTLLTDTTTLADTVPVTETIGISSSESASATVEGATTTAISATATIPVPVADTPTPAASTEPRLTVIVAALRMRSGPSTEYTVLGAAAQGEQYPIIGQAYNCQWYQVAHPQLGAVWLSGSAQHVATDVSCDQVAAAILPTPQPAEAPTATPVPAQAQQTDNPTPAQPVDDPLPADQGCLILQNQLGPELTFTFTSADSSWNDSIKVSAEHDIPYCFKPGNYRVTVDAPPPWPSLNLDFAIQAGYRAYFPIRPQ